jgi:hypothetical protein
MRSWVSEGNGPLIKVLVVVMAFQLSSIEKEKILHFGT